MVNATLMMRIFDSHCHLDEATYDKDREAVIARANAAGVTAIMSVGVAADSCRKAIEIAASFPNCYASVGIHPHDAKDCSEAALDTMRKLCNSPHVCAWGEIGLDFNRMYSPRTLQEKWFVRQLEIAQELKLPLIFHERDSQGRFFALLQAHTTSGLRGVVHCFSGSRQELKSYLDYGLHIGITGIITLKERGRELRHMVKDIPAERLLVETDAPYLTPTPERNKHRRNEPAFVRTVLLKLADVRDDDLETLAQTVWNNTCKLYGVNPQ